MHVQYRHVWGGGGLAELISLKFEGAVSKFKEGTILSGGQVW
jgi:hypothetical protein